MALWTDSSGGLQPARSSAVRRGSQSFNARGDTHSSCQNRSQFWRVLKEGKKWSAAAVAYALPVAIYVLYLASRNRQALAFSFTPSNVPLQLTYQPSLRSSSELGLALDWVPYIHLVSAL